MMEQDGLQFAVQPEKFDKQDLRVRLRVDEALNLIPEISGNRLMVSIRFMRHGHDDRLHPANEDCAFELTLCA